MRCRPRWMMLAFGGMALIASMAIAGSSAWNDGWSRDELTVLTSLQLNQLPPVPKEPSNAVEAMPAAAALGQRVFFDPRFSGNQMVSCASCHDPKKEFQDGRALGLGVGTGSRRTMPIVGAGYSPFLFWDGRKDSLWSQALGPLEDPAEHGGNRLRYAHLLKAQYRGDYESIFGAMPDLDRLPPDGAPTGTPSNIAAWKTMNEASRDEVSRVFANMGKALAAYEKTLRHGESRMDRYVASVVHGDEAGSGILNRSEKNGLRLFIGKGQCVTCHNGPLLTDQHFHNTGIAPRDKLAPDPGRNAALAKVRNDEFNCLGKFSDAKRELCGELRFLALEDHALDAAFKPPGLRNVASRPPYMHAGQIATLAEVIDHYTAAPKSVAGHSELKPVALSAKEKRELVDFLGTLSGPILVVPVD